MSVLKEILRGGAEKALEAGIHIIGGHSVDDNEPKYGLSVTGFVHPDRVWRNVGAQPGDRLVLTKPLGIGIITTALRAGKASERAAETAIETMGENQANYAERCANRDLAKITDQHLHINEAKDERKPRMAKMLDVNTMNGSRVMAKMAGIESTAKTTSVASTTRSTRNSGVAMSAPF